MKLIAMDTESVNSVFLYYGIGTMIIGLLVLLAKYEFTIYDKDNTGSVTTDQYDHLGICNTYQMSQS